MPACISSVVYVIDNWDSACHHHMPKLLLQGIELGYKQNFFFHLSDNNTKIFSTAKCLCLLFCDLKFYF